MKIKSLCFIFLMIAATLIAISFPVHADSTNDSKILDRASLLSDSEFEKTNQQLNNLSQKYNCDVMIVIVNTIGKYNSRDSLIQAFAKSNEISDDYVILLINMDTANNGENRGLTISCNGKCAEKISDKICNRIYENIKSKMSAGQYFSAFQSFTSQTDQYLSKYARLYRCFTKKELIITFGISLLIAFFMILIIIHNAGGTVTTNARTYLNAENSRILAQRDQYIRTTVTKVKKPKNNNNSKNSGNHSSGRPHSSGGGSF